MYQFIYVFLSHWTGFSMDKTCVIISRLGLNVPIMRDVLLIEGNILAYSPVGRGDDGKYPGTIRTIEHPICHVSNRWTFKKRGRFFFNFSSMCYDGRRFVWNKSFRKSIEKSLAQECRKIWSRSRSSGWLFFQNRSGFRRRGESLENKMSKLLKVLTDGRGEQAFKGW